MKKWKVKPTRKQMVLIRRAWVLYGEITEMYHNKITELEKELESLTKIKGIEFFYGEGGYCGIGNTSRTMKLLQPDLKGKLK